MDHTYEDVMQHKQEGRTTKRIERTTSRVPSGVYLTFAIGSIAASAALMLSGRREESTFVGQWAPTFLLLGLYNKLVKVEHEVLSRTR